MQIKGLQSPKISYIILFLVVGVNMYDLNKYIFDAGQFITCGRNYESFVDLYMGDYIESYHAVRWEEVQQSYNEVKDLKESTILDLFKFIS